MKAAQNMTPAELKLKAIAKQYNALLRKQMKECESKYAPPVARPNKSTIAANKRIIKLLQQAN